MNYTPKPRMKTSSGSRRIAERNRHRDRQPVQSTQQLIEGNNTIRKLIIRQAYDAYQLALDKYNAAAAESPRDEAIVEEFRLTRDMLHARYIRAQNEYGELDCTCNGVTELCEVCRADARLGEELPYR